MAARDALMDIDFSFEWINEFSRHTHYDNGSIKAKRVLKSTVDWYDRQTDKVIAIDFGTSTLAVAYQLNGGDVYDLPVQEDRKCIPTVLLMKNNGTYEIGEKALCQYGRLEVDIATSVFFEKVKLELQHDRNIYRSSTVRGSNCKPYYLIEVIALILKKIKSRIEDYFRTRGGIYTTDIFNWVLTVPALWGEKARDMMREAAYLAGLCSDCAEYERLLKLPLQTSEEHDPPIVREHEKNPQRLSLVFEPEAAATWCMNLSPDKVKDISDISESKLSTEGFFLTVDVGGGTIDITGHQVTANTRMRVFNLPHGCIFGGSVINNAFMTFLEEEIAMGNNRLYFAANDSHERKAEFLSLKEEDFEMAKKQFAEDGTREFYSVRLPVSYVDQYKERLERYTKSVEDGATLQYMKRGHQLRISKKKMQELTEGCLYQIKECIDNAIATIGKTPEILYLVGGFGGCQYVAQHIQNSFKGKTTRVIIPQFHNLAVVKGACLYFKNKPIRIADATYGTVCKLPYDEKNQVHRRAEKVVGKDGTQFCKSLFKPFIHIREPLDPDYVYKTVYSPIKEEQTTLLLSLYSVKENYVNFVETNGQIYPGMRHLGCLFVDLAEMNNVPLDQRQIKVLIDFSSVEITINAHFTCNGKERKLKTSTDFLSTIDNTLAT